MNLLIILLRVLSGGLRPKRKSAHPWRQRQTASHRHRYQAARSPVLPVAGQLKGKCHVIDGDTLVIKGTKIRLAGIDAPELDQPWGQQARWAMVEICKGRLITAKLNGEKTYDRLVAICYLPDGRDIGAELIKQGLALDWREYSGGRYRHLEPRGVRNKLRRAYHR